MGQAVAAKLQPSKGRPEPGCTEAKEREGGGLNFALRAPESRSAWLLLSLPDEHPGLDVLGKGVKPGEELMLKLDPGQHRTGDCWHIQVQPPFPPKGVKYSWLLDPPLDHEGRPTPQARRLIDPYARSLDSPASNVWNHRGKSRYSPTAIVPDLRVLNSFNWEGVQPPRLHMKDLIIYEAHVRGFTMNPDSELTDPQTTAGTFLGFIEKIPHLLKLGVNCVELLPVFEFDETACPRKNPTNGEQLCNYWGYSTVAFFVPMQRFASRGQISASIVGFKTLVRELHRQGIEVILDVVFNHTAEGTWGEHNWHSWAAIAKSRYYILSHGKDTNYTGCGNTVNSNDGLCADWIVACLRYWVTEMHVDGFRFDLASALCRGGDGKIQHEPWLFKKMVQDPALKDTKLIAEPWDCSWPDGYLVGRFPSCGPPRIGEWNGKFRDAARRFIKGDVCMKGEMATRLCGSSDLFRHNGRAPYHSVNFITAHDGFTLYDLVAFNEKKNYCNGENSGDDHNNSWNCGHEGHTGDKGVQHLRDKQIRNFMVALFVSLGTPMIVYGDECARTQQGCNNGWCQDRLSWFSWKAVAMQEHSLLRFCRLMIAFRKRHSRVFCREGFLSDKDIWWRTHWDDDYNYLCYVLHDHHEGKYSGILVAFNAGHEVRSCDLPGNHTWYRIIDSNLAPPKDFCEDEATATKISGGNYVMQPYSCLVLKCFADGSGGVNYAEGGDTAYSAEQNLETHLQSILTRRMSMELRAPSGHLLRSFSRQNSQEMEEEELARTFSMRMKRQSQMSGCILELGGEDGEEPTFAMDRPAAVPEVEAVAAVAPGTPSTTEPELTGAPEPAARRAVEEAPPEATPAAAPEVASTATNGSMYQLQFQIECSCTKPGQSVFISGSAPELGSWNPTKAIACETAATTFPLWTSKVFRISATALPTEFKLILGSADRQHLNWEGGANRKLALPPTASEAEGLYVASGAWGRQEVRVERAAAPRSAGQQSPSAK